MKNTTQAVYRRTDCRLCGKTSPETVLSLEPIPIAGDYVSRQELDMAQDRYTMDLALCRHCGNVFLLDVVDPEILYKNFKYTSSSSPDLGGHFRGYAEYVLKNFPMPQGAFIVDVGSNDGLFLREFQKRGLRVLGVDPARDIARKATESGIETLGAYYDIELARQTRNERAAANIITANMVMANVDNMAIFIQSIRELLADDGIFIFETGYLLKLVENMVFDNIYHEHLSYFSVKALDLFFKNNGMELLDINVVATKGGSLRGVVQLQGGPRKRLASVDKMIRLEKEFGLDRPEIFSNLKRRIDAEKEKLLTLIGDLKRNNKKIAGYGASHSVTTFLYYFGLGDQLECLFDDNAAKFNTFSPGHHIPILSSEEIDQRKSDHIIILAWRFHEMIVNKHRLYLEKGGHFIVPLPQMRVI
ncbi:MAG: class I SAM-dependent methyltransferase [Candidatus Omnitrophota bacterium]|nr:class I SAM-dependent methyltransferase [Candidatus Omnitrophota bacterium]